MKLLIAMCLFNLFMVFATPKAQTVSAAVGWSVAAVLAYRLMLKEQHD